MMRSLLRFTNRNRPIISLILLMVITGSLATLYFYQPVSALVFRIAASAIFFSTMGISVVIGTWIGSNNDKEAQQKRKEITQEWKKLDEMVDNVLVDKKNIESRFQELRIKIDALNHRMKQLSMECPKKSPDTLPEATSDTVNSFGLFSTRNAPSVSISRETYRYRDASWEIQQLLNSYPQISPTEKYDASDVKRLNQNLFEHHQKVKSMVNPLLDELEQEVTAYESKVHSIAINLAQSSNQQ